ncbi:hypothetical protein HCN44_010976 [Aphidius gifuensis]|uniref:Ubiquitin-like protease family profile domain-containing protein n=1 Tax=Aphidius gifuensis TaxID=684658 RepID=A0A835CYK6_APHGI|nr:hypothetical protein HCN44_010976 [Aphidius gifuensis]
MKRKNEENDITPKRQRTFKNMYTDDVDDVKNGRSVNRQAQAMIICAHRFFSQELAAGLPLNGYDDVWDMTSVALGWSRYTIKKYVKLAATNPIILTPGRIRSRKSIKLDVDEAVLHPIKEIVYDYSDNRQGRKINFTGETGTLRKLLKRNGFKWKRRDGRRFLIHKKEIAIKRVEFLSMFMESKKKGKNIIYLDITLLEENSQPKKFPDELNLQEKKCRKNLMEMEGMKTNNVSNNKENNVDLPSKIEKTNSQLESQNFISDLLKKPPTTKIGTFSNDELFVSDLLTLRPTMWLNDKVDIFSKKWMIIPIHLDNHWAVCIVNFIKKTVSYYDSQGRKDEGLLNIILQYLEAECNKRKSGNFSGWRVQHVDVSNLTTNKYIILKL